MSSLTFYFYYGIILSFHENWKKNYQNQVNLALENTPNRDNDMKVNSRRTPTLMFDTPLQLAAKLESCLIQPFISRHSGGVGQSNRVLIHSLL